MGDDDADEGKQAPPATNLGRDRTGTIWPWRFDQSDAVRDSSFVTGLDAHHPASFRHVLQERLVAGLGPRAFYGIAGDAPDVGAELERYAELLKAEQPVACVMGIGENGHLAFNDPPADFTTSRMIHVVTLIESCRQQQVGEGHFARLEDVPRQAISLTVPALLTPRHILVIAPEARKAAGCAPPLRMRSRQSVQPRFYARQRTLICILIETRLGCLERAGSHEGWREHRRARHSHRRIAHAMPDDTAMLVTSAAHCSPVADPTN